MCAPAKAVGRPPFAATCTQSRCPPALWPSSILALRSFPYLVSADDEMKKASSTEPKTALAARETAPTITAASAPDQLRDFFFNPPYAITPPSAAEQSTFTCGDAPGRATTTAEPTISSASDASAFLATPEARASPLASSGGSDSVVASAAATGRRAARVSTAGRGPTAAPPAPERILRAGDGARSPLAPAAPAALGAPSTRGIAAARHRPAAPHRRTLLWHPRAAAAHKMPTDTDTSVRPHSKSR